jgi:hypothetical protein
MVTGPQPMENLKDKPTIQNNKLSILITQDGFSFCILSSTHTLTHYEKTSITKSTNYAKDLLLKFQEVIHPNFAKEFAINKVELVYESDSFSLVPSFFFEENKKSHYIKYSSPILPNDFFAHDNNEALEITNVYIPYVHINNYLHELFGEFEYQHHLSVLLNRLFNNRISNAVCYCIVTNNFLNFVCFNEAKLVLCNAYAYKTVEDIAYYLLFALEQLNLNREELLLYVSDFEEKASLLEYISPYLKYIKSFTLADFTTYASVAKEEFDLSAVNKLLLLNL